MAHGVYTTVLLQSECKLAVNCTTKKVWYSVSIFAVSR